MNAPARILTLLVGAGALTALGLGTPSRAQPTLTPVSPVAPVAPTTPALAAKPDAPAGAAGAPSNHPSQNLPAVDLTKVPTLFTVGYAHLDTEWRWSYVKTIREFIPNTMRKNLALFEKYPGYVFNFTGSRRYQMMQEYYPEDYAKVKAAIAKGRWFPAGSSVDEGDANVPNAESQVRHTLYGNRYFRREFGVASDEFMLPDCFGFPAALPSMLAHCGIKGFSTQKLTWGSPVGIPFKVGVWEGPDGRSVIAALDPGAYVGEVKENLANSASWLKRVNTNGGKSGVFTDYHYFGTGDQGGAPTEPSVKNIQASIGSDGPLKIICGPADWMFKMIPEERVKSLPRYKGELLLTEHSAGSITSQAYMKRWNRKNELLADATERASVAAWWSGALDYPAQRLEDAWTLVLGAQMHDILPGTSLPRAYDYAYNDEALASNMFAQTLTSATGALAAQLDTAVSGTPIVVYNAVALGREDAVAIPVPRELSADAIPAVFGPDGKEVVSQVSSGADGTPRLVFMARVEPCSWSVYDVRARREKGPDSVVRASERSLENEKYLVTIDDNGDISSILDKVRNAELLAGPARLALQYEKPSYWAAWNMDWKDRQKAPRAYVTGPAQVRVIEGGPARASIEITREFEGSIYRQTLSLAAGSAEMGGDTLRVDCDIDWLTRESSLRASFPLADAGSSATYDLQVGTITRGNNSKDRFENPAHLWMDLTGRKGRGVSILNDCKFGSDKPSDGELRLTLLYTPGVTSDFFDQAVQDLGKHQIAYGIYSHAGDWRSGRTHARALRFNQPLSAFAVAKHPGGLGRSLSLVSVDSQQVMVSALKKAEDSDEVIIRLRETAGSPQANVRVRFPWPVLSAREVDGQERPLGPAKTASGALIADIHGYGLRAYAVKLQEPRAAASHPAATPLELPFNVDVISTNAARNDGAMEGDMAYPTEQVPAHAVIDGVPVNFGASTAGAKNALAGAAAKIKLPAGATRVLLLAAARSEAPVKSDSAARFIGGATTETEFAPWRGFIGQWDTRGWGGEVPEEAYAWTNPLVSITPGYVRRTPVAWFASHYHLPKSDAYYQYCYIYSYWLEVPAGVTEIELGADGNIAIFAATAVTSGCEPAVALTPLVDDLKSHVQDAPRILAPAEASSDSIRVELKPGMYYGEGGVKFTSGNAEFIADSGPAPSSMWLHETADLKAATAVGKGYGPVASRKVVVNDTTAPKILSAAALAGSTVVRLAFSEPIDPASVQGGAVEVEPATAITSARLNAEGTQLTMVLGAPLTASAAEVRFKDLRDRAPKSNGGAVNIRVAPVTPVFTMLDVPALPALKSGAKPTAAEAGPTERKATIPSKGGAPFTLSAWVNPAAQPDNRTIILGLGRCQDKTDGQGRYLAKFSGGLHFWARNRDVTTTTPLKVGAWQLLTATYDGTTVRVYHDGVLAGQRAVALADDEPVLRIAPLDPWESVRRFEGQLRDIRVYPAALSAEDIQAMHRAGVPK
ncbi:hypothetical protein BH11PLA1_BH11PLA1_09530 [soil metagenome]